MTHTDSTEPAATSILHSSLPLPLFSRGKVRDTYSLGEDLLIVATDRISAFDVVLPCAIPTKGALLNQMSAFWFAKTAHLMPNHMIAAIDSRATIDRVAPRLSGCASQVIGRSMLCRKAKVIPVECVVRGYLSGSAWEEYQLRGSACGIQLPPGLRESEMLPSPIFTPTTKADTGHDMPLTRQGVAALIGAPLADQLEQTSIRIYHFARHYALARGIIIADTKMEFGLIEDTLTLIDELLTPDSSRFWDASTYVAGQPQPSYDKQVVRDWLVQAGWDKNPPAPVLPPEVISRTAERYRQAYERLTGMELAA